MWFWRGHVLVEAAGQRQSEGVGSMIIPTEVGGYNTTKQTLLLVSGLQKASCL